MASRSKNVVVQKLPLDQEAKLALDAMAHAEFFKHGEELHRLYNNSPLLRITSFMEDIREQVTFVKSDIPYRDKDLVFVSNTVQDIKQSADLIRERIQDIREIIKNNKHLEGCVDEELKHATQCLAIMDSAVSSVETSSDG